MFELSLRPVKSSLDGIKLFEIYNKNILTKLLDSKSELLKNEKWDSNCFDNERMQLEEFITQSSDSYEYNDNKNDFTIIPVKYKRSRGFNYGRVYPIKSLSLCTIRREVRHTIGLNIYNDIDISNCHPEIIYQTCKFNNIKCDILEDYVKNRDNHLSKIIDHYKVTRDQAKSLFIILLYFGSFKTWLKEVNLEPNIEPIEFIRNFIVEREIYGKSIEDANDDIYLEIQSMKTKRHIYNYNDTASVVSIWCQEIELRILEELYKYCLTKKYIKNKIAVLCFDGIMIESKNYKPDILKEFTSIIKSKYGYNLTFTNKLLDQGFNNILNQSNIIGDSDENNSDIDSIDLSDSDNDTIKTDSAGDDLDNIDNDTDNDNDINIIDDTDDVSSIVNDSVISTDNEFLDNDLIDKVVDNTTGNIQPPIANINHADDFIFPYNTSNTIDDIKKFDKKFFKNLEIISHNQIAKIFYFLNPNKYIYSTITGWYKYNKFNVLISSGNSLPSGFISNISTSLLNYIIPIRNRLKPNSVNYIKNSKNINKLIKDISNAVYISCVVKFLQDLYISIDIDSNIDNNPKLLAFNNKVFDLATYTIRDIKPDDFISKTTRYDYIESNQEIRDNILSIISSVFENKELEEYFLKIKAYSLFGNKYELCIIQVGRGGNGKGLLNTLEMKALGDYIFTTENTFITSSFKQGSANPTLVNCKGIRNLIISEPSESDEFGKDTNINVPFIKLITGNDEITTRQLYKSNISFKPLFTPFIQCNSLPNIKKIDKGLMRRIKIINYPLSFVNEPVEPFERKLDTSLKEKISNISYAREYLLLLIDIVIKNKEIQHIIDPQCVLEETNKYFYENNPVKIYIDEFIIKQADSKIKSSILKEHYDSHSDNKMTMTAFVKAMSLNAIDNHMCKGYRYFKNIAFKPT